MSNICNTCPHNRHFICRASVNLVTPITQFPNCIYNPIAANFKHDCDDCHYLGAYYVREGDINRRYELYVCTEDDPDNAPYLIARYDCETFQTEDFSADDEDIEDYPALIECKRRAVLWNFIEEEQNV